jgi:putative transposase
MPPPGRGIQSAKPVYNYLTQHNLIRGRIMPYDPRFHKRRSIRLRGYDYTSPGEYFVTIVTHRRLCLFGEIISGEMRLNEWGEVVSTCWREIPKIYRHVEIDEFITMPNHLHGIIIIHENAGNSERAPQWGAPTIPDPHPRTGDPSGRPPSGRPPSGRPRHGAPSLRPQSIGSIIGQFKSVATKQIMRSQSVPRILIWHRNYYEHIIRNDYELSQIREYIRNNPFRWEMDHGNH